jgi:hypothetical protein
LKMTEQEKLEVVAAKLDEARQSLGLPLEALGDGTLVKLILSLLTNPGQLTTLLASIKAILDFFKALQPQPNPTQP